MYSLTLFAHEFHLANGNTRRMAAVVKLANMVGCQIGDDTTVRIEKLDKADWDPDTTRIHIEFEVDIKQMSPTARRRLKREVKLEVPSWAQGGLYKSPPMLGQLDIITHAEHVGGSHRICVLVNFTVNGAYQCKQVGEQEVQPSEWEERRAAELAAMTPEQILAEHNKRVADLRTPKVKPSYKCENGVEG